MARYIDADALKLDIDLSKGASVLDMAISVIKAVKDAPAADVAPRSEVDHVKQLKHDVTRLMQDVTRLEQEKDELVRKIFEELGDYAADFVAGHIDDDNFLRAIYTLKAKYTNPVQCRDCAHLMFSDCYGECSKGHRGIVKPDDSCEFGEKFRRE